MVPEKGLEPPRCYPPDFESGASANSATPACLWKTLLKTKPIISYNLISSSFFIVFAHAFLQAKKKKIQNRILRFCIFLTYCAFANSTNFVKAAAS